jgi:hypothetical protein
MESFGCTVGVDVEGDRERAPPNVVGRCPTLRAMVQKRGVIGKLRRHPFEWRTVSMREREREREREEGQGRGERP